jgi:hypothetical protein
MRSILMPFMVTAALACPCLQTGQSPLAAQSDQITDDTTLYRVPLLCAAARGLGCGTRAKPVLLDLQRSPRVDEAWLNHTGDVLAVVWKPGTDAATRQTIIASVIEEHAVGMDPLTGDALDAALKSFRSKAGWHRGADVDRLSEQEARVISDRLLQRVVAKAPSAQSKIAVVGPALSEAIRRRLVGSCTSPSECRDALLTAARRHLSSTELTALREAIGRGFQPVGDER